MRLGFDTGIYLTGTVVAVSIPATNVISASRRAITKFMWVWISIPFLKASLNQRKYVVHTLPCIIMVICIYFIQVSGLIEGEISE